MANKKLNAIITIGGAVTGGLKNALGTTRDGLNKIGKAITDLKARQKELNSVVAQQEKLGSAGNALKVQYANQELGLINRQIDALQKKQRVIDQTQRGMAAGRSQMASAGLALGATLAAASTAFVPIAQAAAFEKAMLGVAKQVDGTRDSAGKLTQVYFDMARQIQLLGRELPMATNEIADMVAAGARMGIAKDELIGFTRTAAMMATAFELPAGELADQMGKIATLFKIPIPNISQLADVINYLDDNAISKGGDIIEVMKRIGGTAEFVKMPAREAAALASTFLTLGSSAEVAATAANAVMRELSIATMQPKRFQKGLAAIGMEAEKVQRDMAKNATGTIQKVLDALNKLPEEKRLTVATQLFGKEYGDDIAKLATGVQEYRRQLELAASDKAIGSMAREHQARLQTTTAQWEIAKNVITEVGVNIGTVLLPSVNKAMAIFAGATSAIADFTHEHPLLVSNIAAVVGTLGGMYAGVKGVSFAIGAATWAFNALKLAVATNPIGLALTAIATAAVLIYQNWEPIKEFFAGVWTSIKNAASVTWEWMKNAFLTFHPLGIVIKNWEPIKGFFTGLFDNIRATVASSIDWILGKINAVGALWDKTKSVFGFGPSGAPAAAPSAKPAGPVPPPVPAARGAAAPGTTVNSTVNAPITINQQPGQNSKQLADEVARRLKQQQAVKRRGAMFDPALGY